MTDAAEKAALDWIGSRAADMLADVEAWTAVNSGSRNLMGLDAMAGLLKDATSRQGADARLIAPTPVEALGADGTLKPLDHGRILLLDHRPEAPIQVVLGGHMDTVFEADHPFQSGRWLANGDYNAPGAADMKGGLRVMLTALEALERSPYAERIGYRVLINGDEEVSSLGSAALLKQSAARAHLGLIYEPALPDGTLAGARKGIGSFALRVEGRAAHAGRNPEAGRNAVLAASDYFLRVSRLTGARPGLTVNVARMEGGGPTNVVPALAIGRFEIRAATPEDAVWAEQQARALAEAVAADREVAVQLHGHFNRPPKPFEPHQQALFELVRACGDELGQTIAWTPTGGCCDGNNMAATGLAVVDSLGVRGGAIHSPDEFLIVESLVERARLSALLLIRLASGAYAPPPRGSGQS